MSILQTDPSADITETSQAFVLAAASYFGVPVHQVMHGSGVQADQGTFDVLLRVSLTPDDIAGVAGRMKAMAEAPQHEPVQAPPVAFSRDEMREVYNALTPEERSQYGSFARYVSAQYAADPYVVQAQGATADEVGADYTKRVAEAFGVPAHLLVESAPPLTPATKTADEVMADYVNTMVAAHTRLERGDGKPTSNADDFGGLPG